MAEYLNNLDNFSHHSAMNISNTVPKNETEHVEETSTSPTHRTEAVASETQLPMQSIEINPRPSDAAESRLDIKTLSHNVDEAMKAFTSGEVLEISEAENKRLLRIIDRNLMPLMCIVYCLNFLDKTSLSYASIMGIKDDLHLVGDNYQWLSSLFYFGYLFWEYPTNLLLQRLPLAKYSAFCIVMWGLVLALFATVSNFGGAVAIRFFLGLFEASVTPGFALLTSQWYTKREQGFRTAIWFSFNGCGLIIGGLMAYGIAVGSRLHGSAIAPWKIVFVLNGCLTICLGIVFYIFMPDNQLNARWLNARDRILCVERVRINQQGIGNKTFKVYQFKEALYDPMSWAIFVFALLANIPNGGISNFFSQLIVSFGYTAEQSLLYGTPGGAVQIAVLLTAGYLGDKLRNRIFISTSGIILATLGMLLIVALPLSNNSGRLAGYYLTNCASAAFVTVLSLISSNVAGYTKKTTVAALYLIGYCIGNIIGPQCFRPADAPRYIPAEIVILVCFGACLIDLVVINLYYQKQNTKKARLRAEPGYVKRVNQEWLDLTDRENPEFTYTL